MKKFFVMAAIAAATMLSFSSCDKEDDEEGIDGSIVATWESTKISMTINDKNGKEVSMEDFYRAALKAMGLSDDEIETSIKAMKEAGSLDIFEDLSGDDPMRLKFHSDGKLTGYSKNEKTGAWEEADEAGSYRLSGNKLTINIDGESGTFTVKTLTSSKMVLVLSMEDAQDMGFIDEGDESMEMFTSLGYSVSMIWAFKKV